jgi:hypothetical protein
MDRKQHWEHVYATHSADALSWFQTVPAASLRLIEAAGLTGDT